MPSLSARAESTGELLRAGAPRPLRLVSSDGAPLVGSPSDVAWERRGGGVFFTLERGGTRNIWRAFPDPQDSSRFPAWRALPVTNLRAPRYAAQPSPLPDNNAIICVSNALSSAPATVGAAQIVRCDLAKSEFRALSDGVRRYQSPMVLPDDTRVAFTGETCADARVFVSSTRNPRKRVMPDVTLIRAAARRPVWLDDSSLLMESLAPRSCGLYRMPIGGAPSPQLIVGGGGEANTMGENGIVFSAKTRKTAPPNLYVIAREGSGLRVRAETMGARRPATAPDGQTLAYDAPLSVSSDERALWVVPLLRVENRSAARQSASRARFCADSAPEYDGPSAQLSSVRALGGGVAIVGSLRGATNANVTLEVGQGGKPRRWEALPVTFPLTSPLLDAEGNRVLATWTPPKGARGDWTLRLSLRGLGGGTQSLLRVRLPLPAPSPQLLPPIPAPSDNATANATARAETATEPLPRATPLPALPDLMPVRGAFLPMPLGALPPLPSVVPSASEEGDLPNFPNLQSPDAPPTVPLPVVVSPPVVPAKEPTTADVNIVPFDPTRFQAPPPPIAPGQTPPVAPDEADDESNYGERPDAPAGTPFVAQFDIAGTPARMAPREKVKVTFWGINRGSSTWETGSRGAGRVRLVARWVDFSTGTRRWWNFFWLSESVAPGERTKREFEVPAPARAGKYKLIYGLVHLPASGEYTPPAYSASQESWADEFGAIAFAVEVAPRSP